MVGTDCGRIVPDEIDDRTRLRPSRNLGLDRDSPAGLKGCAGFSGRKPSFPASLVAVDGHQQGAQGLAQIAAVAVGQADQMPQTLARRIERKLPATVFRIALFADHTRFVEPRTQTALCRCDVQRGADAVLAELADVASASWREFLIIRTNPKCDTVEVRMDLSAKIKALELEQTSLQTELKYMVGEGA